MFIPLINKTCIFENGNQNEQYSVAFQNSVRTYQMINPTKTDFEHVLLCFFSVYLR